MNNKLPLVSLALSLALMLGMHGLPVQFAQAGIGSARHADKPRDAMVWLNRMARAIWQENYIGTYHYMRGSTFDTIHIVHRAEAGKEKERLFNLNGAVREVLREGGEVICYHPKTAASMVEAFPHSPVYIGPFSPYFLKRISNSQNFYRFAFHGDDRVAGRKAVKLHISPRNNDRYGYRLWLDRETGILLQSYLVEQNKIKEVFQFTQIDIGIDITEEEVALSLEGETVSHRLTLEVQDKIEKPVWKVAWLPDGFRPLSLRGNRLHFTDGLATFSVFVENRNATSLPEMTTTLGGTVLITLRLKQPASQVTVVGEVPIATARRVAESVEPLIY